jgi:hypothetical protein
MLCFVSGHDFSRAETIDEMTGFSPCLSCPLPNFSALIPAFRTLTQTLKRVCENPGERTTEHQSSDCQ